MNGLAEAWRVPFQHGWSCFPCVKGTKSPDCEWKRWQGERPTLDQVGEWNARPVNVAIVTGAISGLAVVDVDTAEALAFVKRMGIPRTVSARTGKGHHLYFQLSTATGNRAGLLPGIDIRGDGGFVVAPGSLHETGAAYEWEDHPDAVELAIMPGWLVELLEVQPYGRKALAGEIANVRNAATGQRNSTLNSAAFALARLSAGGAL